jgi:hypothetical protein
LLGEYLLGEYKICEALISLILAKRCATGALKIDLAVVWLSVMLGSKCGVVVPTCQTGQLSCDGVAPGQADLWVSVLVLECQLHAWEPFQCSVGNQGVEHVLNASLGQPGQQHCGVQFGGCFAEYMSLQATSLQLP